ncbi:hypothetical protein [Salidesulfovibrio onnuriiensis]|uniref:hypothetical protein n=1 Tax=Salidesulfovibrio onnuriiensis TaxID=2583823 RepID=UPI0011CC3D6A|nr:hypothetical protein [Salidesulfovibrio onnuriiensis]
MDVLMIVQLLLGTLLFFGCRLLPLWKAQTRGPDAHYFLLCSEVFRKERRLPIKVPGIFLLEDEVQNYPPMFTVFISLFPPSWLRKYYWVINHLLDYVIAMGLWGGVFLLGGPLPAWIALVLYATSPQLMSEYQCMTSRPLASFVFFSFLFTAWLAVSFSWVWYVPALILGVLLVLTHKLTMQLCWFLLPFLTLAQGEWGWFLLLPGAYLGAFLVGGKQFVQLMEAHLQYIRFWSRNWKRMSGHQVRHSPVYGDPDNLRGLFYNARGWRMLALNVRRMLISSLWVVPAAVAACVLTGPVQGLLAQIMFATFFFGLATLVFPWLRGIGDGTKYIKYALPPMMALCALGISAGSFPVAALSLLVGVWHFRHLFLAVRSLDDKTAPSGIISDDFAVIVEAVKGLEGARVMALPSSYSDYLAYTTRKAIFQGGHSSGVDRIEPWFPVFLERVETLAARHGLTHLVLDRDYASLEELGLEGLQRLVRSGPFELYAFGK